MPNLWNPVVRSEEWTSSLAAPSPPHDPRGRGVGTLVVSLLPAGRPDRSGPLTPYPIPHASHTRPREGSKKSQTKEHHLHLITQVNFGSRDGRGSTKSGVSTLWYGVWGIDRSGPLTPYPIPQASHTRSREGSKTSQAEIILQCMPSERNSGSRDGRAVTKSGVSTLGYGVWGMIDTGPTSDTIP